MTAASVAATIGVARRGFALDVVLEAAAGETVAVMGPSGAGKSTLLAVLAGLLRPDAGEVRVGDRVVSSGSRLLVAAAQRGVVLLGQDPRLFPHLTARENVVFGLRTHGADRDHARRDADDWLWRVGLPGVGDHRPAELSGGQQQRVAVARALATSPQVLLLDEPLTALDTETAAGIRVVLAEQLVHATAIVVTHDAVDAVALADRLVVIEAGRVTQQGAVRDVLAAPATGFAASVAGLNRLVGAVNGGFWSIEGIRLPVGSDTAAGGRDLDGASTATRTGRALEVSATPRRIVDGPAAAVFAPVAVAVRPVDELTWTAAIRLAPDLAPGEWLARVERLEPTPSGVRVRTSPADVAVDLTLDHAAGLGLAPGAPLRLRVAAGDIRILPL